MNQEFINAFGVRFLRTEYDPQHNWVHNDWQGVLTTENVIEGSKSILALLERTHCPYMLNDNRQVQGSWKMANDWLEHTMIPQAVAAGLRYHAHVTAPGVFGQASAEDLHLRVGDSLYMRLFEDMEEARHWLVEMQLAEAQKRGTL